jgi:hypothetical protein
VAATERSVELGIKPKCSKISISPSKTNKLMKKYIKNGKEYKLA